MMKKLYWLIFFVFILFKQMSAQTFQIALGNENATEKTFCLEHNGNGGFFLLGQSTQTDGSGDGSIVNLNNNFEVLWSKTYGISGNTEDIRALTKLNNGNFLVLGQRSNAAVAISFQINSLGEVIPGSEESLGNQQDRINKVLSTMDNGHIRYGHLEGSIGTHNMPTLFKYDKNNNLQWSYYYDVTNLEVLSNRAGEVYIREMIELPDSSLIAFAELASFDQVKREVRLMKIDKTGTLQWVKALSNNNKIIGGDILLGSNGSIYICGTASGPGIQDQDAYVAKLDIEGNLIWFKAFGGTLYDEAIKIKELNNSIAICGITNSFGSIGKDGLLLKLDMDGELLFAKSYGSNGDDQFTDMKPLDDGYLIAGYTNSIQNNNNYYIVKTDLEGNIDDLCYQNITPNIIQNSMSITTNNYNYPRFIAPHYGSSSINEQNVSLIDSLLCPIIECNNEIDLGEDTLICYQDFTLDATLPNHTYQWSNGDITPTTTISNTGTYSVTVDSAFCSYSDTIEITFLSVPKPFMGEDSTICMTDTIVLSHPFTQYLSQWNTGEQSNQIEVATPGEYIVTIDSLNCSNSDTIYISQINIPPFNLGQDTTLCFGESITLSFQNTSFNHTWSTGETTNNILVSAEGQYHLQLDSLHCSHSDTININLLNVPKPDLGEDSTLCAGDILILSNNISNFQPHWNTGEQSNQIEVVTPGEYIVTIDSLNCSNSDTIYISQVNIPLFNLGNDTTLCSGGSIILSSQNTSFNHTWSTGETTNNILVSAEGQYHLQLDSLHCSRSDTINIDLLNVPKPDLGEDSTLCTGDTLILSNNISNFQTHWNTGEQSNQIEVATPGEYIVTIDSMQCFNKDTILINFGPTPEISIGNDTLICDSSFTITAISNTNSIVWQDGSNETSLMAYTSGLYYATAYNQWQCEFSDSILLILSLFSDLNIGEDTNLCIGDTLILEINSNEVNSLEWNTGETTQSIIITESNLYHVSATNNLGCIATDTCLVTFNPKPSFQLPENISSCFEDSIIIYGDPLLNNTWNEDIFSTNYIAYESGTIYLYMENDFGCSLKDTSYVTLENDVNLDLGNDTNICEGSHITLNAENGNAQYIWSTNDTTPQIIVSSSGTFSVEVIKNGCIKEDTISIKVTPIPLMDLIRDTAACINDTLSFNLPQSLNYTWSDGDTGIHKFIEAPGKYYVTASNNCVTMVDSMNVITDSVPFITISDSINCQDQLIYLEESNKKNVTWNTGESSSTIVSSISNLYTASYKNACGTFSDSVYVNLEDCYCAVYIPNSFTPDGDFINQYFLAQANCAQKMSYKIFNRWGQLIFESNHQSKGWDGTYKDKEAPIGIYTYEILILQKGEEERHLGKVVLLR